MIFRRVAILLVALCCIGCAEKAQPVADRELAATDKPPRDAIVLEKPIGITTAGGVFTQLVGAGRRLPHTFSETFTNKTDGGPEVLVTLSQKDESGAETVASLIIPIPRVPDNALQITVTLKVSEDKKMTVKTTVAENATVKEFGPFPVQ